MNLLSRAFPAAPHPLSCSPTLPPLSKPALGKLQLARWSLLGTFLENRQRQQDLAVPPLGREQQTECARGRVRAHLVDIATQVLRSRGATVGHLLHAGDDRRNLLVRKFIEKRFHRPSAGRRSIVAPLSPRPPLGLRHSRIVGRSVTDVPGRPRRRQPDASTLRNSRRYGSTA